MNASALRGAVPALGLALGLSAAWAAGDWARVGRMSLPDTDDMMRLVEIRDLLGGQGWADLSQHRLGGPSGLPMHWTRIGDLGPLALIAGLRPVVGQPAAELVAVLLWPALLFAGFLFLSGRIAVRQAGPAARLPGTVLAALAYPAVSLFSPGRIDHHNLQILLVLGAVVAMMRRPDGRGGVALGLATAVSLAVGLETGPQLAALLGLSVLFWVHHPAREAPRLRAAGLALLAGTGAMLLLFRPAVFPAGLCDAFTPGIALAGGLAGAALAGLAALAPGRPGARLGAAIVAGLAVVAVTLTLFPACATGPYGAVDPRLMRLWMANVAEARGVFGDPLAVMLPNVGLIATAFVATGLVAIRRPRRRSRLLPPALVLAVSAAIALVQLRGVYIGAAVAPALVAAALVEVRRRGPAGLALLFWIAGSGLAWLTGAALLDRASGSAADAATTATRRDCRSGAALAPLSQLPPGRLMAPIDLGPYALAFTPHPVVAASYHRNNAGNAAMYDFFLGAPADARAIVRAQDVRYVALCTGDFAELDVDRGWPASLVAQLRQGRFPDWLEPLTPPGAALSVWRVRLAPPPPAG